MKQENIIHVDEETFRRLERDLDNPPKANEKLKRLLKRKPAWETGE